MRDVKSREWCYEWDNDTGPNDDYYEEFFLISGVQDGQKSEICRVYDLDDALIVTESPRMLSILAELESELGHFLSTQRPDLLKKISDILDIVIGKDS